MHAPSPALGTGYYRPRKLHSFQGVKEIARSWLPPTWPISRAHLPTRATPELTTGRGPHCSYQVAFSIVPKNQTSYSPLRNNITDTSQPYRPPRAPSCTAVLLRITLPGPGDQSSPALLAALLSCPKGPASRFVNQGRPVACSLPCSGRCFYFILLWSRSVVSEGFLLIYSKHASHLHLRGRI